jgi:hypothetical protein
MEMDNQSGSKQNRGELAEQILDRIASDAEFRQQLLNNPADTLKQAGYTTSDEVRGYGFITTAISCDCEPPSPPAGTTAMGCGDPGQVTDPPFYQEPYTKDKADPNADTAPSSTVGKTGPASH